MDQPNIARNEFSPAGSSEPDSMRRNTASTAGGNGSSPQAATQDHDAPPKQGPQLTRRAASGPKTELGKCRASRNAIKHAIFSDVIILRREERPSQYRALLERLTVAIQPEGALEEILVEKLATLFWRYRRLLRAERAEIVSASEAAQYSYVEGSFFEALRSSRQGGMFGSAYQERSSQMLDAAVKLLKEMHQEIREKGLDWNRDYGTLKLVYGTAQEYERRPRRSDGKMDLTRVDPEPAGLLAKTYREAISPKGTPSSGPHVIRFHVGLDGEAERDAEETSTSPQHESVALILKLIDDDIWMFQDLARKWSMGEAHKTLRAMVASVVPPQEVAERLQRYEGMLERAVDRTLGQIERLQRLRKGQPATPEIRVNVST